MTFTLYTKETCTYCVAAKELLHNHGYSYIIKPTEQKEYRSELFGLYPNAKTVPQIFFEDRYIGGYAELVRYLKHEKNTYTHT